MKFTKYSQGVERVLETWETWGDMGRHCALEKVAGLGNMKEADEDWYDFLGGPTCHTSRSLEALAHIESHNFLTYYCKSWTGVGIRFLDDLIVKFEQHYIEFPDCTSKLDSL